MYDAAVTAVKISNTVLVYNVSVTARVWWYFPATVHRSTLQTYQSAVSAATAKQQQLVSKAAALSKRSRLLAARQQEAPSDRRRRQFDRPHHPLNSPRSLANLSSVVILDQAAQSPMTLQAVHEGGVPLDAPADRPNVEGRWSPGQAGDPEQWPGASRSLARSTTSRSTAGSTDQTGTGTFVGSGNGLASEPPASERSQVVLAGHRAPVVPAGPSAPVSRRRRQLLDIGSSMMTATSSASVSSTAVTSSALSGGMPNNTMASISGLMKILISETLAGGGGSSALGKVASGVSSSIQQAMDIEGLRGNKVMMMHPSHEWGQGVRPPLVQFMLPLEGL